MWIDKGVIFKSRLNTFDSVSVKDPTIVFFDGKWRMFYTSVGLEQEQARVFTGYVEAEQLYELNDAPRLDIASLWPDCTLKVIAPQLFYYRPQKLWYLVAQTPVESKVRYLPVFCTNKDICNQNDWSEPKIMLPEESFSGEHAIIDFWVICDDNQVCLFFADQRANVLVMKCDMDKFPYGFCDPQIAISERHDNNWEIHEASHIYRDASCGKFLMIVEGYHHGLWENYMDRFMHGYWANTLDGPWKPIKPENGRFWADRTNVVDSNGKAIEINQVSHPEIIRDGFDERMLISEPYSMIYQQNIPSDQREYIQLNWQLRVMGFQAKI